MVVGDGSLVRRSLDALVEFLRIFAQPTGARGSVVLMSGGLILLGFLFLAFVFRSAIVGDLAPIAHARPASPRAKLPPALAPRDPTRRGTPRAFEDGRDVGRGVPVALDDALDALRAQGLDARVLQTRDGWKRVRAYRCGTCDLAEARCDFERGLLAGAFETLSGDIPTVRETTCRSAGGLHCEFEVRHAESTAGAR